VVAYLRAMADTTPAAGTVPLRELPSFVGVADSGNGALSVRIDEILYREPAAPDAAAWATPRPAPGLSCSGRIVGALLLL
jgi:hypothetical protein